MKIFYLLTVSCILGISFFSSSWQTISNDWQRKVDDRILVTEKNDNIDFLVLMADQADVAFAKMLKTKEEKGQKVFETLKAIAAKSQQPVLNILEERGIKYQSFYIVNAIRARGDMNLIEQVARLAAVSKITANPRYKITEPLIDAVPKDNPPENIEWGLQKIRAADVWAMGYEGAGAVVGGQDTGYEWFHPAIQEKYRGWDGVNADHNYNWHDAIHELNPNHMDTIPDANPCGLSISVPCDDHNHGTHTMGTMVGRVDSNFIGVAPAARWIGCRNMDRGWGQPSTYIECFEWFLAPTDLNNANPDPSKSPHVIANSWSCPEVEGCNPANFATMQMAVDNLNAAGVFVVVSAGNSGGQGCNTVNTPSAIFENSFTVGASNSVDTLAWFSSRGNVDVDGSNRMKPNVVAPGVGVRSCIRNGSYATWNGTSMAGPHVAGVVALMISADPTLAGDVDRIRDILEVSALPAYHTDTCSGVPPTVFPNNSVGHGRVDALRAVNEALGIATDVEDISGLDVKFYPNPFSDQISVELSGLTGTTEMVIFDAMGRTVFKVNWMPNGHEVKTVTLPGIGTGLYFYRITNGGHYSEGKLVRVK